MSCGQLSYIRFHQQTWNWEANCFHLFGEDMLSQNRGTPPGGLWWVSLRNHAKKGLILRDPRKCSTRKLGPGRAGAAALKARGSSSHPEADNQSVRSVVWDAFCFEGEAKRNSAMFGGQGTPPYNKTSGSGKESCSSKH